MSFNENTELHVKSACLFELERAEKDWGKTYHSMHEGWAVLKEEVEEVAHRWKCLKGQHKGLWHIIKEDKEDWLVVGLDSIQNHTIEAMKELAQVWAVAEKMKATIKKEEENA